MKVTAYEIHESKESRKLEDKIAELIKSGWEPVGGVTVTYDARNFCMVWAQAMVVKED